MDYVDPYYYTAPVQADGPGVSIVLLLIIAGFVAAMIWLINYKPKEDTDDKDEEKISEKIDKIFNELREDAHTFNRPEFVPSLEEARRRVQQAVSESDTA